jgi:rod shape-determining protein MreD
MEDLDLLGLLDLEDFKLIDLRQAEDGVVIRVESASPPDGCQRCGVVGDLIVKERPVVRVRDLSISGRPAWLWWRKHRWSCRSCHRTFTQSHPATGERQRVSSRLRRHLGNRARSGAAHAEVARDEQVSRYHVGQGARFNRPPSPWWLAELERWPRWISLDEAAHRRNRELPTVISAPEQRRVLDVIPGRSKQAVQQWLHALPADVAANIKVVSIDPYDAYRRAIQAELPQAVIVCDPFHLVRGAGTGIRWAIVGGLLLDLLAPGPLGVHALALAVAAYGTGFLKRSFEPDPFFLPSASAALATVAYNLVLVALSEALGRPVALLPVLQAWVAPSALYGAVLLPPLLLLLRRIDSATPEPVAIEW